ncbi:hypothetical protein PoB_003633700 [Plakobranchus ocellatus]|uniref:Uncharacterized protein n=1 Tax=Plakobranchus ocellatus TaxID=259542 RepID=A0AAV4AR95_9GAST|nr:hypothetical protein PoB_003633700 [Plakobranchus ocellatus]
MHTSDIHNNDDNDDGGGGGGNDDDVMMMKCRTEKEISDEYRHFKSCNPESENETKDDDGKYDDTDQGHSNAFDLVLTHTSIIMSAMCLSRPFSPQGIIPFLLAR